jgi:hypothetical protein
MINVPKIGRIYHVVDKTTLDVVKVGSTIYSLHKRFNAEYRRKYNNHFLQEVRTIESSNLDWYDPNNSDCPFLWHLAAAEHMEIVRMGLFNNQRFSNKISPLVQKAIGFDGSVAGSIGGFISGVINASNGHMASLGRSGIGPRTSHRLHPDLAKSIGRRNVESGQIQALGRKNVESGHLRRITTSESCSKGGKLGGRKNVESGHMERMRSKITPEMRSDIGRKGGIVAGQIAVETGQLLSLLTPEHQAFASHSRWHVRRNIVSPTCKLCKKS